ncbi:methylated-DNA--[protein]-cysteine S-methyltransferase [Nitratireductor luteus]|uniref:methylated-DNA--[protein]-cysteine S-methyltransferase n=1 Tax=Nitratireductor luteus TaxID=2976980 RepID=UPI00223FB233|nr:methylated-DNA--[protein]-cysteine S-methyltransferase [Nitratireductor luteus]
MRCHIFKTAFGWCGLAWSDAGVARTVLPSTSENEARRGITAKAPNAAEEAPDALAGQIVTKMQRYFEGEREDFSEVPLDLGQMPPFNRAIYTAARALRYGETTTYGGLAARAGFPTASRETGVAMGRNPVPLIVPCHRVLAAGGKLGGFSAPGGVLTKQRMLALERARPPASDPAQESFAF